MLDEQNNKELDQSVNDQVEPSSENEPSAHAAEIEKADAAKHEAEEASDGEPAADDAEAEAPAKAAPARHAKHASEVPEYEIVAEKTRKKLGIAIVTLLVLIVIIVACLVFFFLTSSNVSVEQQHSDSTEVSQISENSSSSTSEKTATVPSLAALIGTKVDDAATSLGHGATVSSDTKKDDEDDPVKRVVKYSLANDAGSSSSGTPTVTVNADSDDEITSVTYQTSTKSLGYGTISFQDAVQNEKIIQAIMKEAGLTISDSDVVLPADKADYTTYSDDGKRITKEEKEFSGTADYSGKTLSWSTRLQYDYTVALATDNLADTLRNATITISK
ncbi:MAG: hypothetical protein Q3982_01705 [Phoenicibacter congonensis]|uniref:Histone-lysine N-methyltransferase n=1 Tax=Phoenicibacter congonensis TaxID=1944646 RepID=A0AA43RGL9_9ACTN|nr:hypothetical protein [Phoenicibacter congonensis]